jgi:hypothetical protein
MQATSVCEPLELGINELHEAACALYIMHQYNPAVVNDFIGDEFFGADKTATMKDRMRTSLKKV